ncbi:MAG TPA: GMC family oxidoreductase [Bryobacteraceae bacterium]|jgi:gluconate 2-dehydrogenase alpha chain|nr:GMC family oxidoreductase [Bryobacteraceae bacterium]
MKRLKPVDVVIAGGGWTGLLMAKEITQRTPLSVVVLERGPARKTADYATGMDELDYVVKLRMMQNLADETLTHRHSAKASAVPVRQYGSFQPGTGTGGAGEHWGGLSFRFSPEIFRLGSHLREKHGESKLPTNVAAQDWGLTYDELEPYYWRAEQLMGVGGKAGNLKGVKVPGGNPFEGPRAHDYPLPPHRSTYLTSLFQKSALDLGYHPYPVPTATASQTYRNPDGVTRSGCMYCGYCTRFGCMVGAKSQPTNTLMPLLANRTTFALRNGCQVRRVLHRDGRAEGLMYLDAAGEETEQPARLVILGSWTLNNNRLLMMSKIGEPYDPATGKGTLGRNLTHQVSANVRFFLDKPLNNFMGSGGLGFGIDDFDADNAFDAAKGLLRGGTMRVTSTGEGPLASFGRTPPGEVEAEWGAEWKKSALKWYDKSSSVAFEGGHFPYRQNYLDLDPAYTDKFGDPLIRLTLDWTDHERAQTDMAIRVSSQIARAMGAKVGETRGVGNRYAVTFYQSTHVQGGTIVGASPETSVLNPSMQHWQMPNLWMTGGSTFPQSGSGNPTLTIIAMTYRAADSLIDRYLKNPEKLV